MKTVFKKKGRQKEYMRQYMRNQRTRVHYYKYSEKYNNSVKDRRKYFKEKAIELFGNKCNSCGRSFDPACYDFHHLDFKQKDINISVAFTNHDWGFIEKRLKECVMLCANCHRILHKESDYACNKSHRNNKDTNKQMKLFSKDVGVRIHET